MASDGCGQKPFSELIDGLATGDAAAAETLFRRYSERIVALAKRKIGERLRPRLDAEDIAQSVLGSFFRRAANGEYQFDHSGALWNLLVTVTENKIRQKAIFHRRDKRDVRREAASGLDLDAQGVDSKAENRAAERLASAVEDVVGQLNGRDVTFFQLEYRDGMSSVEASYQTGWSVATINRVLSRVVSRIRERLDQD